MELKIPFKFAQWLVEDFFVEEDTRRSVVVTPGAGFFPKNDPNLKKSLIRIAYVLEEEKLKAAMNILGKGIETYTKKVI